jgi:ABC-type multidrug transport system fused ATPase/permease subunit
MTPAKPPDFRPSEWFSTLSYVIRDNRRRFLVCVVLGLLSNGFVSAANPLALKYLFDEGIIRGDFSRFLMIAVGFVLLFTVWRVGVYFYRLHVQDFKNALVVDHSLRMLGVFYKIPYHQVARQDRGYFLSRIYDEVVNGASLVMDRSLALSNMTVTMVVALIVAVGMSFRATLMVLVAVPIVYVLSQRYGRRIKHESKKEQEEEAKVRGILDRAVGSYKTARIFGLQSTATAKVGEQLAKFVSAFRARFSTSARYEMLSGIFMSYVENIAILSAGYEILAGRLTFGGFMGFMSAFWGVMNAVRGVFGLIPELSRASGMVERLREFEQSEVGLSRIRHAGVVELDGVSFDYDGCRVFSDFHLASRKGERVLIVGPNGSGKSTLAHLAIGLLEPTAGVTTTFPLDRVSAVILPYDFVPGTVRENLGFVAAPQAQRLAGLAEELGVDGFLDKDPSELSAGQRKRLEILMVLMKPADLFILDEPLSGIDVGSKGRIMEAIFEATQGGTLWVILHGDSEFHGRFDRVLDLTDRASGAPAAIDGKSADRSALAAS